MLKIPASLSLPLQRPRATTRHLLGTRGARQPQPLKRNSLVHVCATGKLQENVFEPTHVALHHLT